MGGPNPANLLADLIAAADPGETADDDEFATEEVDARSISNASTSLKTSVLEHSYENGRREFDGRVNCDDGTIAPDAPLKRFYDLIPIAMANFGTTFNAGEALMEPLENTGFVNVSCRVLKVPFGSWAKVSEAPGETPERL
ncbi:hypothetical protein AUP68_18095 [Ilyonectria robusta]